MHLYQVENPMPESIQTKFPFQVLKDYGCHFFSLLKHAELVHNIEFTPEHMVEIFKGAAILKYIDPEGADVLDAVRLLNYACGGVNLYMRYTKNLPTVPEAEEGPCIVRLVKPHYTHFILRYPDGTTWDPLNPRRPAASQYRIDSYRTLK